MVNPVQAAIEAYRKADKAWRAGIFSTPPASLEVQARQMAEFEAAAARLKALVPPRKHKAECGPCESTLDGYRGAYGAR